MAVKWSTIQPGDVLYDVHSTPMGNTSARTVGVWDVCVVSIDHEAGSARVRWNGNPEQTWYRRQIEKLRRRRPELETSVNGAQRIKRRAKGGK